MVAVVFILKLCHAGHFFPVSLLWWSHEHWLSLSEACSCNECELLYYLHKDHGSPARPHGRVKNLKCESCSSVRKDLCVETSTCSLIGGNSVTASGSNYNWNFCQGSVNHPSLMVSKTLGLFLGKNSFFETIGQFLWKHFTSYSRGFSSSVCCSNFLLFQDKVFVFPGGKHFFTPPSSLFIYSDQ